MSYLSIVKIVAVEAGKVVQKVVVPKLAESTVELAEIVIKKLKK
jgi:hypothetical protein